MKNTISVGIYCRLSEKDRNKVEPESSESIKNQQLILTKYATEQRWKIYDIYADDDWAGADRSRPEFNRLISDAREGKINIVLCKTQSRFTREIEIVEKYLHNLFPLWGVRFISLVDNVDTSVRENKKRRQLGSLVDEWYLEDLSKNIKAVLTTRRNEGYYIGSTALYGYIKDPERKGHLIIDEEAAEIVKLVFKSFLNGMSKTDIMRMLNNKGVPNPTEYKRLKGIKYKTPKTKRETLWSYSAIGKMLRNQMYIGNMVQGQYASTSYKTHKNKPTGKENWIIVENTHEAIIDKDVWKSVQNLINIKSKPFEVNNTWILAGKVRCAKCGYVMKHVKCKSGNYLKCPTRLISIEACNASEISVMRLEKLITEEIHRLNSEYLDKGELEKNLELGISVEEKLKMLEKKMIGLNRNKEQTEKALKNIYIDKINEKISKKQFQMLSNQFENDMESYIKKIEKLEKEVANCREVKEQEINKRILIDKYVDIKELTRPVVDALIDYIDVVSMGSYKRKAEVEIHWKF